MTRAAMIALVFAGCAGKPGAPPPAAPTPAVREDLELAAAATPSAPDPSAVFARRFVELLEVAAAELPAAIVDVGNRGRGADCVRGAAILVDLATRFADVTASPTTEAKIVQRLLAKEAGRVQVALKGLEPVLAGCHQDAGFVDAWDRLFLGERS